MISPRISRSKANKMFDISHSLSPSVFLALRLHSKRLAHQLTFLFLQAKHALFHGIGHNILQMEKQLLHHCLVANREGLSTRRIIMG